MSLVCSVSQTQGAGPHISHPCYPAGFNVSMKLDKVFDSPCTADQRPSPYSPQVFLTVMGTGNYQQCLGNMSKLFSFDRCSFSKFSFDGVFQPNVSGSFMVRRIPLQGLHFKINHGFNLWFTVS